MNISDKQLEEFQKLMQKSYGKRLSNDEARDSAQRLLGLVKMSVNCEIQANQRKERLITEPEGFCVGGRGYTCPACSNHTSEGENWYDKWGLKCTTCQKALDKKIIPGSVFIKENSWYSEYDLQDRFNIKKPTQIKWIKDGLLKSRIIPNLDNRGIRARLYLLKDNKYFLPPKKITESKMVKETKDGKDWFHCEPWYKFVDPFECLKGYGIMKYMQYTDIHDA
ncbi:MAG TPA: hypothetical protein PKD85_01535 [Saprospiraceae bacterium]|nr:hypothetical protein [Saprospiraceae bacterium]